MNRWDRLESMARTIGLEGGLEARIADPLWMLTRQWQISEFRGDDAVQPAAVRVTGHYVPLTGLAGHSGNSHPLPKTAPLETVVETSPGPDFGAAGLFASIRASRRLIHILTSKGLAKFVDTLRSAFPVHLPDRLVGFGTTASQTAALFARWGIDLAALADASQAQLDQVLTKLPIRMPGCRRQISSWHGPIGFGTATEKRPA